jgi:two-component system phosphate regulon sensor histidine kinase PhoR
MRFRWRLRPLVVLTFLAVTAVGLLTAYVSTSRFLEASLGARLPAAQVESVVDDFRNAFIAYSATALVMIAGIALLLSGAVAGAASHLRSDTTVRAREPGRPIARPPVAELQSLAAAIDHLAADLENRAEALRRERDELAILVSSVSEGILLVGPGGRIIHANPAVRALLGLPRDCRGQPLSSIVRNAELRTMVERSANGETVRAEISLDDRRLLVHGQPVPANGQIDPVTAPGGVIALVDLTELKRLEGVRRDFVANVSHELKTPLTSIRGYVETLLSDDVDPSLQRQFLDVIQKNAERLHSIVEDLLDLSRLEAGAWHPELEELSLARVVEEVWQEFDARARDLRIDFVPPPDDVMVEADEYGLRQILSNLFDNALRHTHEGGSIRVRFRAHVAPPAGTGPKDIAERELVTVEVQDTGSGIPGDALPRIFERFYRVDPARSRAEGGTGLGLSIVKHLVETMHGEVSAASELGKGTTIRVRLPAARSVPV